MTPDQVDILTQPKTRDLIEKYLGQDPSKIALKLAKEHKSAALVAGQIKTLAKAKKKLPTWFEKRCIIPARAYEQCTSEAAAKLKGPFPESAKTALDLTSGLGVDTLHFAQHFEQVHAVEANETLHKVAAYNFAQHGISHVQHHHSTAEEFLTAYTGPKFDLVYLDPDRRDAQGRRKFLLEDCTPNVVALQDRLLEIGKKVLIKVSPMFDLEEGVRRLKKVSRVICISVNHEVRELLFELIEEHVGPPTVEARMLTRGELFTYQVEWSKVRAHKSQYATEEPLWDFIYEPDPALYKLGIALPAVQKYLPESYFEATHPNGYIYSMTLDLPFPGRIFVPDPFLNFEYKPKAIKRWLKEKGIKRANIYHRNFDLSTQTILKALNLKEGGDINLLFLRDVGGRRYMLEVVREQ